MNSKQEFIVRAIEDTQATIRALDVKLGVLLTGYLLPFSNPGHIWEHFKHLSEILPCFIGQLMGISFMLLWLAVVYILIKGLSPVDNPSRHLLEVESLKGSFYRGGLYNLELIDSFVNRISVQSKINLKNIVSQLPSTDDEFENELAFEQMKVIYIREIKIKRFTTAFHISIVWLAVAVFSFLVSKLYL
jgi:hypothetical protein